MGKLLYGEASFEMSDLDAFYLDAVLAACHKDRISFQYHITLGGGHDYDVVSVTLGAGCPALVQYLNYPYEFDYGLVVSAMEQIHERGMLDLGHFHGL